MHSSSTQGLAPGANAEAAFSRRERATLRRDGFVVFWVVAVCTLFAVTEAMVTLKFDPDLFLTMMG